MPKRGERPSFFFLLYRPTLGLEKAVADLHRCSGTQFCPHAVDAFLTAFTAKRMVVRTRRHHA